LVNWTKHERILTADDVTWATRAMWAPSVIQKGDKYYFFFAANDIQDEQQIGGIGVAVADKPEGPYKDLIGKPLINAIVNRAQPIDQFVFKDGDSYYMIYGGWRRCNIVKLNDDFTSIIPFDDGTTFKEITPEGYVEGPCIFKRNGKYYFMWSEGGWGGPDYRVAYAISDSIFGPHKRIAVIMQLDWNIATSAGHHSVLNIPGTDDWYAIYHRRPLGETARDHRVTCIEKMEFDENGFIKPIKLTFEGVTPQTVPAK
jgi:beta-xylosidase